MDSFAEEEATKDPITLTRWLLGRRQQFEASNAGGFNMLLQSVQMACKVVSTKTNMVGIANSYGIDGNRLTRSEQKKRLNVFANDCFKSAMKTSEQVYIMASEEEVEPIIVDENVGGYAVVFDPLDGASNIDANVSVGTIFGIYKKDEAKQEISSVKHLLRAGTSLVAAGYCVYGAATVLVLTTGVGVDAFTLDPTLGEFILTHPHIRVPDKGKIYSVNESHWNSWDTATVEYVKQLKEGGMSARYIGSMVADVHRTLLYGGVFCYPGTASAPEGKLRLLYECNPLAMIMEQAGGAAVDGKDRILDLTPTHIHQHTPVFLGSRKQIAPIVELYKQYPKGKLFPQSKL